MSARGIFPRGSIGAAGFGILLIACNAIIGTKDLFYDAVADGTEAGTALDSATTSSGGDEAGGEEAGSDAATCPSDLESDPKNCGKCGHDCMGAVCSQGRCAVTTLAANLGNPSGIAIDDAYVYVAVALEGRVIRIPKTGGTVTDLATAQTQAQSVFVDGTTLYWSNGDYEYTPGGTYKGGVWKCTLPQCASAQLVAPGDFALNVKVVGGVAYYAAQNDSTIRRSLPDAGSAVVATTNRPFGLALDDKFAYYTSSQPNLYRAPLAPDAGSPEAIGPLDAVYIGHVAVDQRRVYWVYTDNADAGHVYGALKDDPATRTEYGTANHSPVGIALDGPYLYWTNDGTDRSGNPNGDGQVLMCPISGCPASGPTHLADDLAFGGPIAIDATHVYWVEYGEDGTKTGRVRRVRKP